MTDPNELRRGGSAERQACIPAPLRDLHRATLRQFLATGIPPAAAWITDTAASLGLDASALADLKAADLVRTADGMVTIAYPFSGTPTRQRVVLDEFPAVYAMCAIDALGIPAMTGRDGRITATDPHDDAWSRYRFTATRGHGPRPRRSSSTAEPPTAAPIAGPGR
jgi:hypothetical protein